MSVKLDTFNKCYDFLYKQGEMVGFSPVQHREHARFISVFDNPSIYLNECDTKKFYDIRNALIIERGDVFSSDRECVAFIEMLCIEWNGFAELVSDK